MSLYVNLWTLMEDMLVQIFCKLPEPGKVKTRLAEYLGECEAAELSADLAKRTIVGISKSFSTEIWFTLEDRNGFLDQFSTIVKKNQVGDDLGERMHFALADGLKQANKVVLIGSDCPVIDAVYVGEAFERLNDLDVVLGPAEDGGYGLIGVKDAVPSVFQNIRWGTTSVLPSTCGRLNDARIHYALLSLIWDVDRPADVKRYHDLLKRESS